jgi:hypothetical protein
MHVSITLTAKRPRRRGPLLRVVPLATLLTCVGLLAGACSHASSVPGVASAGSSTPDATTSSGAAHGNALAYSQCMRGHGLADFPDPDSSGTIDLKPLLLAGSHPDLNPDDSRFQAAQRACQSLQPTESTSQQHQDATQALQWSRCFRTHGFPDFPDPDSTGDVRVGAIRAAGIDVTTTLFKAAARECEQYQPSTDQVPGGRVPAGTGGS